MKKLISILGSLVLTLGLVTLAKAQADPNCVPGEPVILSSSTSTVNHGYTLTNPSGDPVNPTSYGLGSKDTFAYQHPAYLIPNNYPALTGALWMAPTVNGIADGPYDVFQWRLFNQNLGIPSDALNISGTLAFAADNDMNIYLGGSKIGQTDPQSTDIFVATVPSGNPPSFTSPTSLSFTPTAGNNTLSFVLRNWAWPQANATALVYKATVNYCTDKDKDNDGYRFDEGDCNDNDANVNPEATELCDGVDNNCDGNIDENLTRETSCGVGACSENTGLETCTAGIWGGNTCDPLQGATKEACDLEDNNCDGQIDEHACNWYCPTTGEAAPAESLGINRWAWLDGTAFFNSPPTSKGSGSNKVYTLEQTNNCSCSQILNQLHDYNPEVYGNMEGHWKYGCSISVMNEFIRLVNPTYHPSLTGTWLLSVNNGAYKHDMFITIQDSNGDLTGTGGYKSLIVDPLPYEITWVLENSSIIGNTVDLTLNYNSSSYTAHITGTIAPDWNSMSGGAGTGGVANWSATRI